MRMAGAAAAAAAVAAALAAALAAAAVAAAGLTATFRWLHMAPRSLLGLLLMAGTLARGPQSLGRLARGHHPSRFRGAWRAAPAASVPGIGLASADPWWAARCGQGPAGRQSRAIAGLPGSRAVGCAGSRGSASAGQGKQSLAPAHVPVMMPLHGSVADPCSCKLVWAENDAAATKKKTSEEKKNIPLFLRFHNRNCENKQQRSATQHNKKNKKTKNVQMKLHLC